MMVVQVFSGCDTVSLDVGFRHFERSWYRHLQGLREITRSFWTSGTTGLTLQSYIPDDLNVQQHCLRTEPGNSC